LHSFYYIFRFTFTAAPASLTLVRKRTDYTRNESSRELSLPRTKVPGNFRSWEQRFPLVTPVQGAKIPGTEKSWYRMMNVCNDNIQAVPVCLRVTTLWCTVWAAADETLQPCAVLFSLFWHIVGLLWHFSHVICDAEFQAGRQQSDVSRKHSVVCMAVVVLAVTHAQCTRSN